MSFSALVNPQKEGIPLTTMEAELISSSLLGTLPKKELFLNSIGGLKGEHFTFCLRFFCYQIVSNFVTQRLKLAASPSLHPAGQWS